MQSDAATVPEYLDSLPENRREPMEKLVALVRENLPEGYVETMNWGMICWEVPIEVSGPTYNGKPLMYAAAASQKNHMALYMCGANCIPGQKEDLKRAYAEAGKKLDMGAACLHFRKWDGLVPEAIAKVISSVPVDEFVRSAARS
ncbi:DUF1801 domain-containing protein [Amaricoccus tamworthensis]|uniref:DUF1801 domain-containing protein n=1 Tax=Amaricoccus tamworthensis TaxID=57002 RepID=UPI003C7ADC0F